MIERDSAIGGIANLFGTRKGSMRLDRILETFGLEEVIDQGNKTERMRNTLRYFLELPDEYRGFIRFFNTLLDRHILEEEDIDELNDMLESLGFIIKDGRISQIPEEDEFSRFIEECLLPPLARSAEEGRGDGAMITLTDRLAGIREETTIVDYGCGNGRLLYELERLDPRILANIHYVGVDIDDSCLEEMENTCTKLGLQDRLNSFTLLKPEAFFESDVNADYIFMVNVLHEIPLTALPELMQGIESKLKVNGALLIHEIQELLEGEIRFVSWDPEDLDILFQDTNMLCNLHPYSNRRGINFVNASCFKLSEEETEGIKYIDNLMDLIKNKVIRIISELREIYRRGVKTRRFAYLLMLRYNIEIQITEFEEIEYDTIDRSDPLPFVKCPQCGSRDLDRQMSHDISHDEVYFVISCNRCEWGEWTQ